MKSVIGHPRDVKQRAFGDLPFPPHTLTGFSGNLAAIAAELDAHVGANDRRTHSCRYALAAVAIRRAFGARVLCGVRDLDSCVRPSRPRSAPDTRLGSSAANRAGGRHEPSPRIAT